MANLEGMPIGSLPEATDIQDEDEIVVYRPSTGKAYQANTDLIESLCKVVTTANTDLNDYVDFGVYYFSGSYTPNNVASGTNGWCVVLPGGSANTVKQFWVRLGTAGTNDYQTFVRSRVSGSWGPWWQYAIVGVNTTALSTMDIEDPPDTDE